MANALESYRAKLREVQSEMAQDGMAMSFKGAVVTLKVLAGMAGGAPSSSPVEWGYWEMRDRARRALYYQKQIAYLTGETSIKPKDADRIEVRLDDGEGGYSVNYSRAAVSTNGPQDYGFEPETDTVITVCLTDYETTGCVSPSKAGEKMAKHALSKPGGGRSGNVRIVFSRPCPKETCVGLLRQIELRTIRFVKERLIDLLNERKAKYMADAEKMEQIARVEGKVQRWESQETQKVQERAYDSGESSGSLGSDGVESREESHSSQNFTFESRSFDKLKSIERGISKFH